MATELKFAVLFQAVDRMSDKFSSIGGGITDLAERASQGGERIAQLGERMTSFGEKMSLVTALVSEGASTMREWTESLSEPAMAMEHSFATAAAITGLGSKALAEVREHAVAFSNTHPGVTADQWVDGFRQLYGVYGDTAKAMKAEDVGAKLARFGVDGQSAIRLLAVAQSGYGVSAQQMGDQLIRSTKVFPLAASNMQQYTATLGRLTGFAATSKTPLSEMMAIVGEASQIMGGGKGMSTIQTLFSGLQQSVAEGKSDIDISHGGLNALLQLRDKLQGMSGTERIRFLHDMGIGAEQANEIMPFLNNLGAISGGLKKIGDTTDGLDKTYSKATANAADLTKLWSQNIDNLKDAVYSSALPTLDRWMGDLTGVTQGATRAAEKHSTIMRIASVGITVFGTGVYSAVSAMSSLGAASVFFGEGMKAFGHIGKIGTGVKSLVGGLYSMASGLASMASGIYQAIPAIMSFDFAMLANPLVWIPAAIIGVGALAAVIYEYWGPISAFVERLWASVKGIFIRAVTWMESAGANLMHALGDGILSAIEYPYHAAERIGERIKNLFVGHSPPPEGPLHDLGHITIAETIANRIRARPILSAITRTAAAVAVAAPLMATPAAAAFGPGREPAAIAGSAGAGQIINYTVNINAAGMAEEALLRTLEAHAYELRRILNREDERRARTELK